MTILSIVLLVLQLVILGIGVLIGYRRGLGKSTVRLCYLAIIAVVSFFVGRAVAFSVSGKVVSLVLGAMPDEALVLLERSPEMESLVAGMIGGLVSPIIFAVLFGLLQLLSLIFFKTISTKLVSLVTKDSEAPAWGKWAGAGVGLVSGYLIAMALLMPFTTALYMVSGISDETITIFADAANIELAQETNEDAPLTGALTPSVSYLAPSGGFRLPTPDALVKGLTAYGIINENQEESGKDNLASALPKIADVAADALYAYQKTLELGGDEIDAVANAASRIADYLDESPSLKQAAVSSLRAIGSILEDGDSFMGMAMPESDNPIVNQIIDSTVRTLASSSESTVKDDMLMLFGSSSDAVKAKTSNDTESTDVANTGLYSLVQNIDLENPMEILKDEKLSSAFIATMGHMSNLPDMHTVVDVVRDFAMDELHADEDLDLADESFKPFYDGACDVVEDALAACREQGITSNSEVAKQLETAITTALEENDFPVPTEYIPMIAICAATEFNSDRYTDGISVTDLLTFFGVTDIPAWAD